MLPKARFVGERLTAGAVLVPVPERATAWGLPLALSPIVRVAEAAPLAEGLKVTLMAQLAPAATELPQVLVSAKLLAFVPEMATLEMPKASFPEFVKVMDCAVLVVPTARFPKARLVEERLTAGATPVPERATACAVPLALPAILRAAEAAPMAEGVKVTLIAQLAPAATLDPQVLLSAKLLEFAPETETLEMLEAPLPELVKVTL